METESNAKKILISIPIAPYIRIEQELVTWLIKNIVHYNFQHPGRYKISYDFVEGKPISSVRNHAINRFMASEHDFVLTVDSDIVPPENCIDELMKWNLPIVGALCFSFQYGHPFPVILNKTDGGYSVIKDIGKIRLQECKATGASCLLIKREVIVKMKEQLLKETKKTMFYESKFNEQGEISCGQDFVFCDNAEKVGYKIYVDTGLHCDHKVDRVSLKRVNDLLVEQSKSNESAINKLQSTIGELNKSLSEERAKNNGKSRDTRKQEFTKV